MPRRISISLLLLLAATLGISAGCQPEQPTEAPATVKTPPSASSVPLRIWIAAQAVDTELVKRKWLANSEQPIDIRVLSWSELLELESCACDVLLYPARLLGELEHRKWIAKLPSSAQQKQEGTLDSAEAPAALPAAKRAQAEYGGTPFAVPLGCSLPVAVLSPILQTRLDDQLESSSQLPWSELLSELPETPRNEAAFQEQLAAADKEAVVDRFLAIAASRSTRNTRYGVLFDLRSMQALLEEPEFVDAAEILKRLAAQTEDGATVLTSHSHAWRLATESTSPLVALASNTLLDAATATIKSGAAIAQLTHESQSKLWNTGGGLNASIAYDCRQSAQSVQFLQWLGTSGTRDFLATNIVGVDPASPVAGVDSVSWKAFRATTQAQAADTLPLEPRIPSTPQYRDTLATELLHAIAGTKTPQLALGDAARRWNEITRETSGQQRQYERSLGLTF
ncbi:hypothetical protein [Aureliella helgolandensis]|uniref:Bacterial extracellular solute-binding protein n=1 Tax=Aureliella helgolandensis TaxID=2527968 RepID=A0A518G683_9BACT|nr:hypothetical protein [Aureliella helgolandensis]QDV24092.1 hypothetical protein Q31a_24050 [Aureliella helgolandensis]